MKDLMIFTRHLGTGFIIGSTFQLLLAFFGAFSNETADKIFYVQSIFFIVGIIWFSIGEYFYLKRNKKCY